MKRHLAEAEYQGALWLNMLHRGGANVRANKERRICNRIACSRYKELGFSQRTSHCKRNLYRQDEGPLYGADKERESLALF